MSDNLINLAKSMVSLNLVSSQIARVKKKKKKLGDIFEGSSEIIIDSSLIKEMG